MTTFPEDRPERMYQRDRAADQQFAPTERLFVRCRPEDVLEGRLAGPSIRFPDWSTNREKYSEPEDVLIPNWPTWGIAAFAVEDVPPLLRPDGGKEYAFKPVHDPLADNFAHTEVRAFKDGVHRRDLDVPKSVKKLFRTMLSQRTIVLKNAGA